MTTKVKIELLQQHMPVVIIVSSGPEKLPVNSKVLENVGDSFEDYVHSNQYILVQEMSTAEQFVRNGCK